jgi:hypothetical protein
MADLNPLRSVPSNALFNELYQRGHMVVMYAASDIAKKDRAKFRNVASRIRTDVDDYARESIRGHDIEIVDD